MSLIQILDRPIAFHRCLVTVSGSVNAALMLSQAIYWSNRCQDPDGWFWKSAEEWEEETGLTRREQETARKQLKSRNLMSEKLKNSPPVVHFQVNSTQLEVNLAFLSKSISTNPPNQFPQNRQTITTETTSEITTETTSTPKPPEPGPDNSVKEAKSPNDMTLARVALFYLNEKAGRGFRETEQNLALIKQRLKEVGWDISGVKKMIDRMVSRWRSTDMGEYLRPSTLFSKTKFSEYYDNRNLPAITNGNQSARATVDMLPPRPPGCTW